MSPDKSETVVLILFAFNFCTRPQIYQSENSTQIKTSGPDMLRRAHTKSLNFNVLHPPCSISQDLSQSQPELMSAEPLALPLLDKFGLVFALGLWRHVVTGSY